jgi:hypothetical protein
MKFFFPDSQDLVDPSFDFHSEARSESRLRHRDDQYAHEVFDQPPYDGLLVSMASVEGKAGESGRYTLAQRHRLLRVRVREFFRIGSLPLETMGDCGAFSYVSEEVPPVTVEEVIAFYEECGFDYGVSVDHIILAYQAHEENVRPEWKKRQEITLEVAQSFLRVQKKRHSSFHPIGVAQGWSPASYAHSVTQLQKMGYGLIGLGGMVPLKSHEILDCLAAVAKVRHSETRFHLFGVSRCDHIERFADFGVVSFDSTSPLRQAFKHDRENYYTLDGTYSAIRVPQVEANPSLKKRIVAGEVDQAEAVRLEQGCLRSLNEYDQGKGSLKKALALLREYDRLHDGRKDRTEDYRATLEEQPWKICPCSICKRIGIHVVLFRGAERNRRRGFHNVYVTYRRLQREISRQGATAAIKRRATDKAER